jgi:hypothetical protein
MLPQDLTEESLKAVCPNIITATCEAGSALYVPAGYFVLESVDMGPLCFGVRKSFFLQSSKQAYKKAKELMLADSRDVKKMDEILGCFSEDGQRQGE